MAKALFRKHLGRLVPDGHEAEALINSIRQGELVEADIRRPRNLQHHRKFFALLRVVFENQEYYSSTDHLLAACKHATGHVDVIRTKRGQITIPKSISFAKMDQAEFNDFYDRVVTWVVTEVIPGLDREDLEDAVLEILA